MKKYKKHEFCITEGCAGMRSNIDGVYDYCSYAPEHCLKTAKEFHKWLQANGFQIVKPDNKGNTTESNPCKDSTPKSKREIKPATICPICGKSLTC